MWNVNPKFLCRQHLLGEHLEQHMFTGSIRKGISMDGYINGGLVEIENIKHRHDELVEEMNSRGMNHKSPLIYDFENMKGGHVDVIENIKELSRRCPECERRIKHYDQHSD